ERTPAAPRRSIDSWRSWDHKPWPFRRVAHATAAPTIAPSLQGSRLKKTERKEVRYVLPRLIGRLRSIQTNCGNLHVYGSLDVVCSNDHLTPICRRERAPSTTS